MSEEHDESIQLEQVTELAPKPKRVYKKKSSLSPELAPLLSIPTEQPVESLAPPSIPTENVSVPVVKEKKARTQKQIDAFNKMREAYLNKRKTPIIEPVKEPEPVPKVIAPVSPATDEIINELGTKKVQKPRAKKIKQVEPQEEPQNVHANPPVINNSPPVPQPPTPQMAQLKVSTAPRFLFV